MASDSGYLSKFNSSGTKVFEKQYAMANPDYFYSPSQLAFDSSGNIYIADSTNNRIQKYDSNGNLLQTYSFTYGTGALKFMGIGGLVVDSSGNLYISDAANNYIQKISSAGAHIATFGTSDLNGPAQMFLDGTTLYVADEYNNQIVKYNTSGTLVGTFNDSGNLSSPKSIHVDASGNMIISDQGGHYINVFNSSGTKTLWIDVIATGSVVIFGLLVPTVTADTSGNIYIGEINTGQIRKYDSSGVLQWSAGAVGISAATGYFYKMAIGPCGEFYAADSSGLRSTEKIAKFDMNGNFQATVGGRGFTDGLFYGINYIAIDSSKNIYVSEGNEKIQKFNSSGTHVSTHQFTSGSGDGETNFIVAFDIDSAGNIYIVDQGNNRIQKFDSNWNFLMKFGTYGSGNGQFDTPYGIKVTSDGSIWVLDNGNARIQKFNSSGVFVSTFGTSGSANGEMSNPTDMTIDTSGNIYVADTNNHRIQVFDSSGSFVRKFGTYGSNAGKFTYPDAVRVDSSGNIYVTEQSLRRIQKFNSTGTVQTQ